MLNQKKKIQNNKIRDEEGNVTINSNEIQKIITEHFENLNYKMENLKKMCKFLDTHDLSQWNQKFSKKLNRPRTSEIEGVIKQSSKKEKPGLDEFTAGFLQTVKKKKSTKSWNLQMIPIRQEGNEDYQTHSPKLASY